MPMTTTATVQGDDKAYQLSPEIKKYTLRDVGFTPTKTGNFQVVRSLDPSSPYQNGIKLKITIDKDLKKFRMSITDPNGLQAINIFKGKNPDQVEQYQYFIDNLIERKVLAVK
ncbi:hypothetical protein IV38_GL000261 [Lactobacillus selangorensis]|uniref:Cysteine desulfurase n=1 Tax=Lactobacillus selangorensis TaxID=81857 RepID=A0A0R2G1E6_9LACO|nr:DUF1831 domain-containing protein [Lactobacillus selangorensis]KRN29377.1 hypothetical protein IV38_GL000261 [Lactobacillus selangorensis]KRN34094.1 hypothetical protein IV40_GL000408 [Lactobacillus selangorensis]